MIRSLYCLAILCSFVLSAVGQTGPVLTKFQIDNGVTVDFRDSQFLLNPSVQIRRLPKPHPGTDKATIENVKQQLKPYRDRRSSVAPINQKTSAADSLVMLRNFFGNQFNGFAPNDNDLAISNHDEVCSVTNTTIMTKDQVNNLQYGAFTLHFVSQSLGLQNEEFDPKVLYDPQADRFIMVCLNGFRDTSSNVIVGFSQDSSSYGSWQFYSLPGNPLNNNLWTDFPMIAVNDDYLFITANLLYNDSTWQAGFNESIIWRIPKMEGYTASTLNPTLISNVHHNGEPVRNLVPVKGGSGSYGPDFYFLSNRNFAASNDTTFLVTMPPGPTAVPTLQPVTANVGYHMPAEADQPFVDNLVVNDARYLGAFYENDVIQGVCSTLDTTSGYDGIYHFIIDNVTGLMSTSASIYTAAPLDIAYPNIAYAGLTAGDNAAVISLLQSSATVYPGCGAVYYDNTGSYSGITTVQDGISYTNMLTGIERWGDYTGCQTRFNMPGVVWMNGSYTAFSHSTRTWIAELAPSVISSVEAPESIASSVDMYPNPVSDVVSLDFELTNADFIIISLYDINGKLSRTLYSGTLDKGINSFSFSMNPLSGGMYILSIVDSKNNILASKRLIKD